MARKGFADDRCMQLYPMRMETSKDEQATREFSDIGVVVPTLGGRADFLRLSILSIRSCSDIYLIIVKPSDAELSDEVTALVDEVVTDPGQGLAAAINAGFSAMPNHVKFITWLGDDDRLVSNGFSEAAQTIRSSGAVGVFGQCRYVDERGQQLLLNRSGSWAVPLMHFGPQLVPQPGSLIRRDAFIRIGCLDTSLKWAFDLDMFLKLKKLGKLMYVPVIVSEFRWHNASLTVGSRDGSVNEASIVRRNHLPKSIRPLSAMWEPLIRAIISQTGKRVTRRQLRTKLAP